MTAGFIHLRVHTAYSLATGAIKMKELIAMAAAGGFPAVAVTDLGNMFGVAEFSSYGADAGLQPIVGTVLNLTPVRPRVDPKTGRDARFDDPDRVLLLVQNEEGYANLLKLVSHSYRDADGSVPPQVDFAFLAEHAAGLILFTGMTDGAVGRALLAGNAAEAAASLAALAAAFPGRTYVEVQRHGLPDEERIEAALVDLAYARDLPLVATNDVYFGPREMFEAHDALICISDGVTLNQPDRRRFTAEHGFKSAAEMRELFADLPEACDNTLVVARRCAFRVPQRKPLLPAFTDNGASEEDILREKAKIGLDKRLEVHVFTPEMNQGQREEAAKPYRERLDYELGVIVQMGFPGYFLIVADFIQWSKAKGIPVGPGRGSGAGSVVAWALTITDLDPLRFNLLFERFLNPERISMPDFDIDFCQDRREETIRYVQERYGREKVAQIITFGKLQARAVLRDVGRVLGMPYGQTDKICKLVPNNPAKPVTLGEAIAGEPKLREMRNSDSQVRQLFDIGLKLEGLYRNASTHAAGVVIGDRPLDELVPLYRDPRSDMPVTQFNMAWVESTGLIKFDFLGLKTLTVLATAVKHLEKKGVRLSLEALPLDDRPSYEMLTRGDTAGVFQLESQGMRDVLRKLRPDTLEDIIAVVALYRPGPMSNIPSYINRKHGDEPVEYMHPSLEAVLKETYGIIIYQEQVMQIAQVLAGYTLGGADLLRRAMGKKKQSEMDKQRQTFLEGAAAKGVNATQAAHIFEHVDKFAGYGFNKSHAAAYALVAYQTAYLKANHPVEFLAATMTLDLHNTDKLAHFKQELDRLKIKVLPPDVNASGAEFTVEYDAEGRGAVRYALAALKNVGEAAMQALVAAREAGGRFNSLMDFAERVEPQVLNRRSLENLVRAGAFDSLEPNRSRILENLDILIKYAQAAAEERTSNQVSMFGGGGVAVPPPKLAPCEDWPPMERLNQEFGAVGFYLSAHPLDAYASLMERLGVVHAADLAASVRSGGVSRVKMAGIVVAMRERIGKTGKRYAFAEFSDATGSFEVTLFSEVLGAARELLEANQPLLMTVEVRAEDDQLRLTAQEVSSLDRAAARAVKGLCIVIEDAAPLAQLRRILAEAPAGRHQIRLTARLPDREVDLALAEGRTLGPQTLAALRNLAGIVSLQEL
ncbi:DNA polymerase III subunit alpha [Oleispirillum naphthae]|uniref:DNA polymerase III subunit alpha n=1 Tax=Oleispirillum naphthae TaxID=2838853 RepID=UPI0030826AD5